MSDKKKKHTKAQSEKDKLKAKQKRRAKKRAKGILTFVILVAVLAALSLGVRYFLFETAKVTSNAMEPVYKKGDIVVINKLMDVSKVQRGDLIYASFAATGGNTLIRRVAGVADDRIELENGHYILKPVGENDIDLGPAEELNPSIAGTIQQGQYLLLSLDLNDATAYDSRQLGLVTADSFVGTPGKIIWPLSRIMK